MSSNLVKKELAQRLSGTRNRNTHPFEIESMEESGEDIIIAVLLTIFLPQECRQFGWRHVDFSVLEVLASPRLFKCGW